MRKIKIEWERERGGREREREREQEKEDRHYYCKYINNITCSTFILKLKYREYWCVLYCMCMYQYIGMCVCVCLWVKEYIKEVMQAT